MNASSFLITLLLLIPLFQDQWKNVYSEKAWADRDRWQKADELIRSGLIRQGAQVADIGANEGYLTVKLSAAAGNAGKVFAVDVNQSKLDILNEILEKRALKNVTVIKGEYDNPLLPVNSLDAVFILDSYHEMDDHDKILEHVKLALKKGGRLILCEPIAEERRSLTRNEQEAKHELGMNFALEDLIKAGFTVIKKQDHFADRRTEKGDEMWMIVAAKRN
ncbi:MAG: methyltransferase domain-containing protein [Bacteroidota bacterium]